MIWIWAAGVIGINVGAVVVAIRAWRLDAREHAEWARVMENRR